MTEVKITVDGVEIATTRHVGWKEIMAYVELGRRAIRRLEESAGFPMHRLPGRQGKVYVYADEVERWMRTQGGTQKTAKSKS